MIFERNWKNPTKRNGRYGVKDFYRLQTEREFLNNKLLGDRPSVGNQRQSAL